MNLSSAATRLAISRFLTGLFLCALIGSPHADAQTAPKLVSVTPAIGETNAAPHDSVVFVFDQEMQPILIATIPGLVVGDYQFAPANVNNLFSGSWSADHKTLTFKPTSAIALNTAVTWTLSPAGAAVPLMSAAGVALVTTTGNFKIASNSGGNPSEICTIVPTTGSYVISKTIQYSQAGPDVVGPQAGIAASFSVSVSGPPGGPVVTNGSLTLPDGSTKNLTNQSGAFRLSQTFTTESNADAAFPPGNYTLRFTQTNDLLHEIPLALPSAPTVIPKIENYAEAQSIDATKDFTLQWSAFSPQTAGAIIRLAILDEFGNRILLAPNPCVPRTLDPTATSIVIPAGYLRAGFYYQAFLTFTDNFYTSTTDVAQMTGNGFVQRTTSFSMKALSAGALPSESCNSSVTTAGSYSISKYLSYQQTSATDVIPRASSPALFSVAISSPNLGPVVTNGSVTLPDNSQRVLANQGGFYVFTDFSDSEAMLNANYPSGGYTLRFQQTGQPERVVDMAMADPPTATPMILNYAEAQGIDATKNFTLQWNAFTPQVPGAFLLLVISDAAGHLVFMAPNPCIPRALDPTATSIMIPTNYFSPGATYTGQLVFGVAFYSQTDTNGMLGYGAAQKSTSFSLQSTNRAVVLAKARFTGYQLLPNGRPQLNLSGTPNQIYTILRSQKIATQNWNPLVPVTMNSSGIAIFEDTDATLTFPAFYRAIGN